MPATDGAARTGTGPADGTLLTRHRTPGHVLEALWFLRHARDLVDGPLADPALLARVAERALRVGWDGERGGLFRYTDVDGGPPAGAASEDPYEALVRSTWNTKLWWPHAEALYAARLLANETGDVRLDEWADRVHDYTFATFPDGPGREWTQIRTRTGEPLEKTVALPVKDPFHVARALLLLSELEHAGPDPQEER
ncbi:AGE family epimerase/isomerase [Georgenia sp. SUBG003]|uniref:AGE family epimerase/isomerase n=1 Tax=Georgenia sp. SUBG003 TaxID=1497974 RepID=UPI0006942D66